MVDVPRLPGVPLLGSYAQAVSPLFLTEDAVTSLDGAPQQWGIYLGGQPVVVCDTVLSFDYRQDWDISDAPTEQGAFMSYNKVKIPYAPRFRFVSGGSLSNREKLLNSLEAISGTLTLFDAVSPEKTYTDVNVIHVDYQRASVRGLGLMMVDVFLRQVRIVSTVSAALGQSGQTTDATGSGSGVDAASGVGGTQASTASASTQNAAGNTQSASGAYQIGNGTLSPLTSSLLAARGISSSVFLGDIGAF